MNARKNPVERCIDDLCDQWLHSAENPHTRLLIWRVPADARSLLEAFFAAQQRPQTAGTPDLFLRLDPAFETGYGYSRELKGNLLIGYAESRDDLREQGIESDWDGALEQHPDTAAGLIDLLDSFASHHAEHFRHLAVVLAPTAIAADAAMCGWLADVLQAAPPPKLRLVLIDTVEHPRWQPLLDRGDPRVQLIESQLNLIEVARATASASGAGDGNGLAAVYRQLLTDCMSLLDKSSASQTAQRADRALALAQRQQWPDQQVVMHMIVAGAWLKEKQHDEAVQRYVLARECAEQARDGGHPAGAELIVQTWFGQAGALFAAKRNEAAAAAYIHGAEAAHAVPNPLFVIEGQRMAGYCLAQARQRQAALERYLQGVAEARKLDRTTLVVTTFPLLLADLLTLQDTRRAEEIERTAKEYGKAIAGAQSEADIAGARLGPAAGDDALKVIDQAMVDRYESIFAHCMDAREKLIAGGDVFFRKVVSVGRELLHPAWNGLPDIKHPLDKSLSEWQQPPAFLALPSGDDLAQTPLDAPDISQETMQALAVEGHA